MKVGSPSGFEGGKLDKGAVTKTLNNGSSAYIKCAEVVGRKNPKMAGKVGVKVALASSGGVTPTITSNTTGETTLGSCIQSRLRQFSFPKPTGGDAEFQFSLEFKAP